MSPKPQAPTVDLTEQLVQMTNLIKETNEALRVSLVGHFGQLEASFGLLKADVHSMSDRMRTHEGVVAELSEKIKKLEQQGVDHQLSLSRCEADLERAEAFSRRNNVRLVGLSEDAERETPLEKLVVGVLEAAFPSDPLLEGIQIEVAQRVPAKRPPVGTPPRTVLIKTLSYKHRTQLLQLSRQTRDIGYQGDRLNFYPDQTRKVQAMRMGFWQAKRVLKGKGIQYATVRQATLRISHGGRFHFFDDPVEALEFAQQLGEQVDDRTRGGGPGGGGEGVGGELGGRQS